jgi:cobalt-zinc-cadmium efflux system protein
MTLVAFAGFCINLIGLYILFRAGSENLNIRSAMFHVASDLLGSVGAIAAGLIMLKTGWYSADPVISALITLLILRGAWKLFSESVHILLEGTPRGIELKSVENAINSHEGVIEVHDLHAWTLAKGFEALSAHVVIEDIKSSEDLVIEIRKHLHDKFQINHVTLQIETRKCEPENMTCY